MSQAVLVEVRTKPQRGFVFCSADRSLSSPLSRNTALSFEVSSGVDQRSITMSRVLVRAPVFRSSAEARRRRIASALARAVEAARGGTRTARARDTVVRMVLVQLMALSL